MLLKTVFVQAAIVICVCAVENAKESGGYPVGLLGDCPGSTKEARITPRSLKYMTISVVRIVKNNVTRRATYNYYQVERLAKDKNLDFRKKTLLYVPGYVDHTSIVTGHAISTHYKALGYNVLLLDTILFTARSYPVASRLVPVLGQHAAEMLANLTQHGLDPKKLELVGPSLGSQTMGFIAKNYYRLTGRKISTLTGLDPSGSCFRHLPPEQRLDKSDADFLQVISTNIDGFGTAVPIGHVQFYVNGGEYQPLDLEWMYSEDLTSHSKSFVFWIAAIENPKCFIGIQCDSVQDARESKCYDYDTKEQVTNVMGLNVNRSREGIFYLPASNIFPYCLGVKGLKKENDFVRMLLEAENREDVLTLDLK